MARIRLEQILAPLKYSGSILTVTGSDFVVSGSSTFLQQTTSSYAVYLQVLYSLQTEILQ